MRIMLTAVLIAGFVLATSAAVFAGSTAAQTFNVQVSAINEISVSASPGTMNVTAASAGVDPTPVTDATTTYSITTNETNKKITGQITAGGAMPAGTWLSVTLQAPPGATSAGEVDLLAASAVDLVTGITKCLGPTKTITYELGATAAAGTLTSTSKTITFTIAAGA